MARFVADCNAAGDAKTQKVKELAAEMGLLIRFWALSSGAALDPGEGRVHG